MGEGPVVGCFNTTSLLAGELVVVAGGIPGSSWNFTMGALLNKMEGGSLGEQCQGSQALLAQLLKKGVMLGERVPLPSPVTSAPKPVRFC